MSKKRKAKAKLSLAKKRSGVERRKLLLELAGHACLMCGFSEWWALEFHHVGKKRFTLNSRTLGIIADEKLILSEFDRCVLLCSNCHKGIHYGGQKDRLLNEIRKRTTGVDGVRMSGGSAAIKRDDGSGSCSQK